MKKLTYILTILHVVKILHAHTWKCSLLSDKDYDIPKGSFCSDFCWMSGKNPYKPECKKETFPIVDFIFHEHNLTNNVYVERSCWVETSPEMSQTSINCINVVANLMKDMRNKNHEPKLIYIVHGFRYKMGWLRGLKDGLFKRYSRENTIVAKVLWIKGASKRSMTANVQSNRRSDTWLDKLEKSTVCCEPVSHAYFGYGTSAANTWLIGIVLSKLHSLIIIGQGEHKTNANCIGYSLGAHVCGFFGKSLQTMSNKRHFLNKIVGLDPAGPIFEYKEHDRDLRLNQCDAKRVEILYTNRLRLGFGGGPLGHLEFYINGGYTQPWCGSICSHAYVTYLLIDILYNGMPCYFEQNNDVDRGSDTCTASKLKPICIKDNPVAYLGDLDENLKLVMGKYEVKTEAVQRVRLVTTRCKYSTFK